MRVVRSFPRSACGRRLTVPGPMTRASARPGTTAPSGASVLRRQVSVSGATSESSGDAPCFSDSTLSAPVGMQEPFQRNAKVFRLPVSIYPAMPPRSDGMPKFSDSTFPVPAQYLSLPEDCKSFPTPTHRVPGQRLSLPTGCTSFPTPTFFFRHNDSVFRRPFSLFRLHALSFRWNASAFRRNANAVRLPLHCRPVPRQTLRLS